MKQSLLFLFVCLLGFGFFSSVRAQSGSLFLEQTVYDFGEVELWENPPAIFRFQNRSNQSLMFLPTKPPKDILIQLPEGKIMPGEQGEIEVRYYTPKTGFFEQKVAVYAGTDPKPYTLTVKGVIKNFAPGALTECPAFGQAPKTDPATYSLNGIITDELTGKPLPGAVVEFQPEGGKAITAKTDAEGKFTVTLRPGNFRITGSAEQYKPSSKLVYLNRNVPLLTIGLATEEPAPIAIADEKANLPQTLIEPQNEPIELKETVTPGPQIIPLPKPADETPLPLNKFAPNNIVLLIDISLSMTKGNKFSTLQACMRELIDALRDVDRVTIIGYATKTEVLLQPTPGNRHQVIKKVIDGLVPYGLTYGVKGLEKAYEMAEANRIQGGNNQIIIASDGLFNSPNYDEKALFNLVKKQATSGVKLSVAGFGSDQEAVKRMTKLAYFGKGKFVPVSTDGTDLDALLEEIRQQSIRP